MARKPKKVTVEEPTFEVDEDLSEEINEAEEVVAEAEKLEDDLKAEAARPAPVEKEVKGRKVIEDRTPSGNIRHRYL